ncbi:hypothetical protein CDD82_7867 [Ophiocordyceps australis]|uniref:Cytochrome P450 n=1 Tax=Ophiocordyceps australis TaxID=1399860 RepID=A0A2C5YPM8_9HYPO|nr:hypothetical protein CDD82_7867 [Ophiocordyceps australis]
MRIVHNTVQDFYAGKTDTNDMGSVAKFHSEGCDEAECEMSVLGMIVAATHTTATAIYVTFVYILSTPMVYVRLKEEIAQAVKNGTISSPITDSEIKSMLYLQAVVLEGLRMLPPAPTREPKLVPPEGETLQDRFIPGGTTISHNTYALMRDQRIFGPDAELFRPERYLQADKNKISPDMKAQVELCFGHGQWGCMGKQIAMMDLHKLLFELFRAFDMQLLHPGSDVLNLDQECAFLFKDLWVQVQETRAF